MCLNCEWLIIHPGSRSDHDRYPSWRHHEDKHVSKANDLEGRKRKCVMWVRNLDLELVIGTYTHTRTHTQLVFRIRKMPQYDTLSPCQ